MRGQVPLCQSRYLPEQRLTPFAAYDRPDLEHAFGAFWKPIDASHEYFLDRIGQRHGRGPGSEPPLTVLERNGPRFTQRCHQFLEEERHPFDFIEYECDQIVLDMV